MKSILEKLFPSLGRKIAAAVIIVFLIVGGVFVYIAHQTGYTMLRKQAQSKAKGVAEFGQSVLEYVMLSGKNEQLKAALERAINAGDAYDVLILDKDGKVIISANNSKSFEKIPLDKFYRNPQYPNYKFLSISESDSLYEFVATPILNKPECRICHQNVGETHGYLAVKISMNSLREASLEHRTINIIMTIITLAGLGSVLYIALTYLIIRPVKELNKQIIKTQEDIEKYERGEQIQFTEIGISNSLDEVANLRNAFNNLINRLNVAHTKLHELHQLQLEHADRLATAGEMAASMAHEIKNPIAGVLGALQIFDGETPKEDDRKEIIAEMITQLERVNNAVNDLLYFARPTPPFFESVSVNDLIRKTVSLLAQQIKDKNIQIQTKFYQDDLHILADKKQIQQVLWNVMLNAVQAMDRSGRLTISILLEDSMVNIQVVDTGKGIYPEQLEQVFKPFFTTKHKGTGLGMTISKRIIEQHNGKIFIQSVVGRGTTVTILLPLTSIHS